MGSSGIGSFSDYSNSKPQNPNDKTGGSSGANNCEKAFTTNLEEIARCTYFLKLGHVPSIGTKINIIYNKRLVVINIEGQEIGFLPTRFNYIKFCMESGFKYEGVVSSSANTPIPSIIIDVVPII